MLISYTPIFVVLLPLMLVVGLILLIRKYWTAQGKSKPFTRGMLRPPGKSLLLKIEKLTTDRLIYWLIVPLFPLILYAGHVSQSYFQGVAESAPRIVLEVSVALIFLTGLIISLIKIEKKLNKFRLAYEGELAVAQEIDQLLKLGYEVFHDFVVEGRFNIDHIIVGPSGVYAVETKTRSKIDKYKGKDKSRLIFNGSELSFPGWHEKKPIEQAVLQAKWLGQWLAESAAENAEVKPVVAVPGWYVETTEKSPVIVVSPVLIKQVMAKDKVLTPEQIQRICHQLRQQCVM